MTLMDKHFYASKKNKRAYFKHPPLLLSSNDGMVVHPLLLVHTEGTTVLILLLV
jgi:hypothetical protein